MIIFDELKNKTILAGLRNTIIVFGTWNILPILNIYDKRGWHALYDDILTCFYSPNMLLEFFCAFVIFLDFTMAISEKISCWICGKRIGIIFVLTCNIYFTGFFLLGFFSTAPYTILGLSSILYFTAKSQILMKKETDPEKRLY